MEEEEGHELPPPPPPPPPHAAALPSITHPRSQAFRDIGISEDDFERIASLADHSAHTGTGAKLSSLSRECKRLVEVDRLLFVAERAYSCAFLVLPPYFGPTNKCDLLVAAPTRAAPGRRVAKLRESWPEMEPLRRDEEDVSVAI